MKTKTSELIGDALDWAVERAKGTHWSTNGYWTRPETPYTFNKETPAYSTDWVQGGPIIEREKIGIDWCRPPRFLKEGCWAANENRTDGGRSRLTYATTPLIAAMQCYVASKLGDEVEIPNELKTP